MYRPTRYTSCTLCHCEKAWCDASLTGFPCTMCRLSKNECRPMQEKSLKNSTSHTVKGASWGQPTPATLEIDSECLMQPKDALDFSSVPGARAMAQTPQVLSTGPLDNLLAEVNNLLGPEKSPFLERPVLPLFLQDIPSGLPGEDVQYLDAKGVFDIPNAKLCQELLTVFVEHVYPFLPVLDLESFLQAAIRNDGVKQINLLLFHAVMFSATSFVRWTHLQQAGYQSRKDARRHFFQKTRALYDFDIEGDRIALIQALLLMTYWHESLENPKDSRYWLDVCWSLGVSIGLHRDPSGSQMSPRRKGLWKRLWWCLYTRDRLLSLNLRRPIGFKKSRRHKAEVPVVSLDAFDIHRYSPDILTALRDCPFLRDAEIQKRSAINFVKKSRLSLLISEVVMLRDYGRDQQISPPSPESPNSQAGEEYTDCSWEEQCQKTLEGLHDLYATIVTTNHPEKSNSESSSQVGRLTYIQCAWNQLELLASISTVHRQLMASAPEASATHASAAQNFQVSIEIATIIQDLHQANLVPYLPATAVALLVPVLGTLVLNMRSASFSLRIGAFQRFYQCMRALDTLGETYFSAQTVRLFFEGILGCGGSRLADVAAANPAFVRDLLTQHEVESLFSVSGGIGAN